MQAPLSLFRLSLRQSSRQSCSAISVPGQTKGTLKSLIENLVHPAFIRGKNKYEPLCVLDK